MSFLSFGSVLRIVFFVLVLLIYSHNGLCNQVAVSSAPLKYDPSGSNGWYPYYIDGPTPTGIAVEVVQNILKKAKIQGQPTNLPPKRTQFALKNGLIDFDLVNPDWLPDEEDKSYVVFSKPIFAIKEHVVYLPDQTPAENFLTENQRFKPIMGVVRGYYYHDTHLFISFEFNSEKEVIEALKKRRVPFGISGDLPALYWANKLNVDIVLGPVHSDGFLHMRLRKEHQHLLPNINNAIDQLKRDGELQRIIKKYTTDL